MKVFLLNLIAFILLILGIIGIFVPILPTTPFLLGAALITVKTSPFLYKKISQNQYLSHFIRNYYEHCGVPKKTILKAFIFLWLTLGISILLANFWWLKLLLILIGIGVSCHLLAIKKSDKEELKFTLIELLISLGIIALLSSLLLSAIGKTRTHALKSLCMNNLHQIGMAIHLYSSDNNDYIPALINELNGSSMVVKMGNNPIGLGRIIDQYGTVAENYGCPLNNRSTPQTVRLNWQNKPVCQIAYFYRYDDADFSRQLSADTNNLKAIVMDFCCISSSPIIAHNFEDVNILYADNSIARRQNSATPNELYTVSTFFTNGQMQTDCRKAWENADRSR